MGANSTWPILFSSGTQASCKHLMWQLSSDDRASCCLELLEDRVVSVKGLWKQEWWYSPSIIFFSNCIHVVSKLQSLSKREIAWKMYVCMYSCKKKKQTYPATPKEACVHSGVAWQCSLTPKVCTVRWNVVILGVLSGLRFCGLSAVSIFFPPHTGEENKKWENRHSTPQ